MKVLMSMALIYALSLSPCLAEGTGLPGGDAQASNQAKPSVKEAALAIQAGQQVEVRTKNKEKVVGKLGAVTNDTLEVRVTNAGKEESRQLNFADVKSIKEKHSQKTLYITLAVIGIALAALCGLALARTD